MNAKNRENIILVGFMASGKSTLGPILAKEMNWTFIDTDEVISQALNQSVPQIIARHGMNYFRSLERQLLFNLKDLSKTIIATGGGFPLYLNNMQELNDIGFTVFLDGEFDLLKARILPSNTSRPLAVNPLDLHVLYKNRQALYLKANSKILIGNNAQENLDKLKAILKNEFPKMFEKEH